MKRRRRYMLFAADALALFLSVWLAMLLKYEWHTALNYVGIFKGIALGVILIKIMVFNHFSLYKSLWEYASIEELIQIVMATFIGNVGGYAYLMLKGERLDFAVIVLIMMIDMISIGAIRFSYRILRRMKNHRSVLKQESPENILIIGAGSTAGMISKEIRNHPDDYGRLIGFIDDDPKKHGIIINGVKVLGNRYDVFSLVKRHGVDQIIFAIPTASPEDRKEILEECKRTGVKVKTVPGIQEIVDGKVGMHEVRDVNIEDLLGREAVDLNMDEISDYLRNRVVLVTGGGGSIGSELCRQIAKFGPRKLVILDIYENNAYEIQNELRRKYKNELKLDTVIASVRDRDNIFDIMDNIRPDVVFHAAAHKHVPLMENAPKEAIKNNVFGTLNVAEAADRSGVRRFVMVSTDKAVNPTNVMGASKRICEMIVQAMAKRSQTKFVGVRFGNVLGSNGSVIPLFKRQIAEGGPVTVTHKEIIRYFMTIPEAAQLVIQAGAMASGGEIFVLDMGDPVRIADLAEDLIRLSGFKPYDDIDIVYTGLRPGEKLYEELLMDEEIKKNTTANQKIFIGSPEAPEYKFLMRHLDMLQEIVAIGSETELKDYLEIVVPTYVRENANLNRAFEENGFKRSFERVYREATT